ncbi:MAG: rRNA methyltransferase [Chitinophagaceae bacterium]|nr:rRNA methyltransferase [Chitinophagaceae bacterium]
MHLFYSRDFSQNNPVLDEKESHHAIHVLRLQRNDSIAISDGAGNLFHGSIQEINKKSCVIHINEQKPLVDNSAKGFHLAVSPTKSIDRMEWMVEKCTELGIGSITFLKSRYSERKEINLAKLEAIAVSAMKQSQRTYMPALFPMIPFTEYIQRSTASIRFIACQHDSLTVDQWIKKTDKTKNNSILIGPEGGFSEEEVILALQKDTQPIALGSYRLRTETAAIAACQLMNHFTV